MADPHLSLAPPEHRADHVFSALVGGLVGVLSLRARIAVSDAVEMLEPFAQNIRGRKGDGALWGCKPPPSGINPTNSRAKARQPKAPAAIESSSANCFSYPTC